MTRTTYKLKIGGNARCRCSVCGEVFGGLKAFDAHRIGDWDNRRCIDMSEGDTIPAGSVNFNLMSSGRGTYWSLERGG